MSTMQCEECGFPLNGYENTVYCPECGCPVNNTDSSNRESHYDDIEEEMEYSAFQHFLLEDISYRGKAHLLINLIHWLNKISFFGGIVFSIVFPFMNLEDLWWVWLVGPVASYLCYYLLELILGLYGIFVELCNDVHEIAKR